MSTLHSNAHDGNSRRSSQAFLTPSLEAPQSSKVCNLGPQTSVHSSLHQGTLLSARNKVGVFHSLASLNWQTDGARQPRVGPVPLALCEREARRLVRPLTYGRVPAQQSYLLCYSIASVSAWHWMASSHRLRTLTEPFWSRDSQWVHREDENGNRRSKVCNSQSTGRHEKILWLMKNSGSGIQT